MTRTANGSEAAAPQSVARPSEERAGHRQDATLEPSLRTAGWSLLATGFFGAAWLGPAAVLDSALILTPFPGTRLYQQLLEEDRLLHPGQWDRCTLFDLNFRPHGVRGSSNSKTAVMQLWRDRWNGDALAARKVHYERWLRARRGTAECDAAQHDTANEHFPVPANGVATEDRAGTPLHP